MPVKRKTQVQQRAAEFEKLRWRGQLIECIADRSFRDLTAEQAKSIQTKLEHMLDSPRAYALGMASYAPPG